MDSTDPTRAAAELLQQGLTELGVAEPETLAALLGLAIHLGEWAGRLNLTGHRSLEEVVRDLILEAAAMHVALPPADSIADIGSGAGFPGLPLAVLRPATRVTLIESRERRHHFQRFAIRELRISNAIPLRGRAEELSTEPHALALAQAAAQPALVLPWLLRWLPPGGLAVVPGAAIPPAVGEDPRVRDVRVSRYRVPISGKQRTLWTGRYEP